MGPTAADLKARLQRGLRDLQIADGEVLRGRFLGPVDDDGTDVENLVLTNIEIPAAALARAFAFEHDPRPPDDAACGYEYEPVDSAGPFNLWRAGVEINSWEPFELKYGVTAPAIWWQARKRRGSNPVNGSGPPGRLMVRTEVTHVTALSLDQIKATTDGVLAAAQWMPHATVANTAKFHARLLAAGVTATPAEVVDLLRDPAGSTLGPRKSLITRGGLVSPSDHLVVAGIVAIGRGRDTAPRLSARVYAATAVAHRPE
jgi:hypothetical protein